MRTLDIVKSLIVAAIGLSLFGNMVISVAFLPALIVVIAAEFKSIMLYDNILLKAHGAIEVFVLFISLLIGYGITL